MFMRTGALVILAAALAFQFTRTSSEGAPSAQAMQAPTPTATALPTETVPLATPTVTVTLPPLTPTVPTVTVPALTPTTEELPTTTPAITPTAVSTATPAPTSTATVAADLTLTLDGNPDVIPPGGVASYFLTVANVGTAASAQTTVIARLPGNTALAGMGRGCAPAPTGVSCAVPALQPGQSVSYGFGVSAQGGQGTIVVIAIVDPNNQIAETNEANNSATTPTAVVILPGAPPAPPPPGFPGPDIVPPAGQLPPDPTPTPVPPPPAAVVPPIDVAGVQVVPPQAQSGELWLQILAPTQAYSVDMDPLWVAMPGEWYIVTQQDSGWALAVWEGDTTGWSVWIPMDEKVLATIVDRADPRIATDVWLVVWTPTEAYSSASRQLAWMAGPGEWYRVLQTDGSWALAVYETDPLEASVWIPIDSRVELAPGDAPHTVG